MRLTDLERKTLWNGNGCGKNAGNDNQHYGLWQIKTPANVELGSVTTDGARREGKLGSVTTDGARREGK